MSQYEEHQQAIADAIGAVCDGALITHYVTVAAGINADGEEFTTTITSPGLPMWMTHGLLSYEAGATTPQPNWMQDDDEADA